MPKISICIPYHDTPKTAFFLSRLLKSVSEQTFTDYEIVLTREGSMPVNSNAAIWKASGEIVKILYMDDYFADANALRRIAEVFEEGATWAVSGCLHQDGDGVPHTPHIPSYSEKIYTGINTIGSPSVLAFRKDHALLFDERLSWLLDCDLYKRLHDLYGTPKIIEALDIVIGIGPHQTSNSMNDEEKRKEYQLVMEKHA